MTRKLRDDCFLHDSDRLTHAEVVAILRVLIIRWWRSRPGSSIMRPVRSFTHASPPATSIVNSREPIRQI
jgi:hypothetical protein